MFKFEILPGHILPEEFLEENNFGVLIATEYQQEIDLFL